ncbi:oligosaccharide flippase family protein [Winogradskyella algicola]|uniref:oligosaccharide flippase family protein n=1 Tax=Winogradskyella algicola TaxID=2575815 RepID=UPI001108B715|nr:oligosaccharide flippase family protein [Winogradskyella algicola]
MSVLKSFFKDTIIYGLATVLPRLMNFVLVPLHTDTLDTASYSDNTYFYVYAAFFNVLLTYGMETAFFRFFSKQKDQNKVYSTTLISLLVSTLFVFVVVMIFSQTLAEFVNLRLDYFNYLIGVLVLDTLVVAPFAYLRATGKPIKFTFIKLSNIFTYVVLNFFFLWGIPKFNIEFSGYDKTDLVKYIFIANLAASAVTIVLLLPYFLKTKWVFDKAIFKKMLNYGLPIMIAGLAYVINENFDKWLIPDVLGKDINGAYAGCYKLAVFMTIFIQAFRLGAEPFFFNHAKEKNAKNIYALIMKYFVICGALMLLFIVGFIDVFKALIVRDEAYWVALEIVPIVLLANLFLGIYFNLAIWYKLTDKTRFGMYFSIVGAVITIVLNVILLPKHGFIAAAWTTLVAYAIMMMMSYVLGQKHYKVPYQISRILGYIGFSIALSYVSYKYLRGNYFFNVALMLIFIAGIALLEREELKQLLKRR